MQPKHLTVCKENEMYVVIKAGCYNA